MPPAGNSVPESSDPGGRWQGGGGPCSGASTGADDNAASDRLGAGIRWQIFGGGH